MSSRSKFFILLGLICVACNCRAGEGARTLRIAADPNNLPFSNAKLEGFENKIADLIAKDLGARIEYVWRAQRRGFFRETLKENTCDLVMGVPADFERALTTKPYYRSSYVFVSRADNPHAFKSFDDPALRTARVGVQLIGDDGMNTPPAHALADRGIVTNVVGFTIYGNYAEPNPPARIVEAVGRGDVDVAVVWGPLAGFFAQRQQKPLKLTPIVSATRTDLASEFDIAVGVRKRDRALRDEVDSVLAKRRSEIEKILDQYGVPRVARMRTNEMHASISSQGAQR